MRDIIETIRRLGRFNKLLELIELTGHTDSLKNCSGFTLFAPVDEAFEEMSDSLILSREYRRELLNFLKKHIVRGRLNTSQLNRNKIHKSMEGTRIKYYPRTGQVNGRAELMTSEIKCNNGIVYAIDKTILN